VKNKVFILVSLLFAIIFLSGCTEVNEPITSESPGIWNEVIVYPLSWLIIKIAQFFGSTWGYGLSIIVITILIRLVLLPLMIKQMKSSKAMQAIQPELLKLKEKYSSKDAVTQQKFQEEQLKLMQKYDVNPMAGCLPILVQLPILLGFYHAIMRTEEIKGNSFLWFELAEPDPYFILPILAGVLTFVQQKVLMKGQQQNPQLAMMLWMMPIMIAIFGLFLPSALPLYWIVGNIFSIAQGYYIKTPEIATSKPETAKAGRTGGKKK
jgi:YidC/Oxa1 family membrane protein insertase